MKFSLTAFFLFVFIACFIYDDPYTSLTRRLIYSTFLYLSIWQLILFKIYKFENKKSLVRFVLLENYYIVLGLFVIINLITDFFNPSFKIITLLNNSFALAMVIPLFALEIGYFTNDISRLFKLFFLISFIFILVAILPIFPQIKFYEGNISGYVILPIFIYFYDKKKYLLYLIILLGILVVFSFISDIRTIFLRIILFFCLLISLTTVKNSKITKRNVSIKFSAL